MKTNKTFAYGIFAVLIALAFIACDNGNNETHTHDYGTEWKSNATQHWHECSCGEKTDIANHTGDPCAICGYASGSQNPDPCECNGNAEDCECDDCDCPTCEEEIVISSYTVTFDADNGSEPTTQTVTEGNTANKPVDPSKTYTPIGLYLGTSPAACTFVEWQKPDGSAWNFTADTVTADITLTAQWTSPSPIDITNETGNNIVEKAVSYVNANGGSEYTLVLGEDVSDVAPQTLDQDDTTLTITSDGNIERKISLGQNGRLFTVGSTNTSPSSAKLIIDGHVTLEGRDNNTHSIIWVINGGCLDLKGYTKITGNIVDSYIGGGLAASGTNTGSTTVTMSGNAEISNNTALNDWGGGVFIGSYTTFTMSDNATIKNNNAAQGGGVFIGDGYNDGVFIMNGGEITNNITTHEGGGVYIYPYGTFIVANEQVKESIHSNTATNGSQVYIYTESVGGTFTVGGEPADSF